MDDWLRAYSMLVLRVNRMVRASGVWSLDYYGPASWRAGVETEPPTPAGSLVATAEELLDSLPFESRRSAYLAAQLRSLRALVHRASGAVIPLPELVRDCLGLEVAALPESLFEAAHARLDRALPAGPGSLPARLQAWREHHSLPMDRMSQLPALVGRAAAECRTRTATRIVELPDGEEVDCEVLPGAPFRAVGWHRGGLRSTILINGERSFNLADLLYVVAHEGHPGHIAEQVLKEISLTDGLGRVEQQVRFLPSPPFVLSEGLGLHAQPLIFPGQDAQTWLTGNVLRDQGIEPDGSDFAAIHEIHNVLFGVRANAALLAAEGRPESEVADYLTRWGLLDDQQLPSAVRQLTVSGGNPYIFAYYYGWDLLGRWLTDTTEPARRVRRLLTEQLLPSDLEPGAGIGPVTAASAASVPRARTPRPGTSSAPGCSSAP